MSPFLLRLFNVVFSSDCYPTQWSEGLITLIIHKKGSLDVNNYRGITLINILSKIYSHLLNNLLLKWAEQNEKLSDCQFGFQRNKFTVDCIFIFHALISKTLSDSEKLYCGLAQLVAHRTLGRGVPGSILVRGVVCCGIEQVTFPQLDV